MEVKVKKVEVMEVEVVGFEKNDEEMIDHVHMSNLYNCNASYYIDLQLYSSILHSRMRQKIDNFY